MENTTGGLIPCVICSTVLHVQVPNGKFFGTHLVRCGHCLGDFDIKITGPHVDSQSSDYQSGIQIQSLCSKHNTLPSFASSSTSSQQTTATTHHVVKPPEKKHRLPSAYNRFMKEEIQRIKAAKPDIPHREAFSMASKNWARRAPRSQSATVSDSKSTDTTKSTACHHGLDGAGGNSWIFHGN